MSQRKLSFAGEISREVESTIKKLKIKAIQKWVEGPTSRASAPVPLKIHKPNSMHFSYMYIFVVHVLVVNFAPGDPPEFPDG